MPNYESSLRTTLQRRNGWWHWFVLSWDEKVVGGAEKTKTRAQKAAQVALKSRRTWEAQQGYAS